MNSDFISNTPNPRYQTAFRRPTPSRPIGPQPPSEPPVPPDPSEIPPAPENFPPAPKKPSLIPLIICILFAIAGIAFGIIEFLNTSSLKTENNELKTKLYELEKKPEEKPEKPEEPVDKNYSGTSKFEFSSKHQEGIEVPADIPTLDYSIDLNFDTGELSVKTVVNGNCPDENCGEDEYDLTLTDKELGKIWQIMQKENFEEIEVPSIFVIDYAETQSFESALTILIRDDSTLRTKENADVEDWEEVSDYDIDNNSVLTYREYSNKILDDILFEIYGWVNCMPSIEENPETNCGGEKDNCAYPVTDCIEGPEGTDCEVEHTEIIYPYLDCKTAERIGYPYIAY